jgi:hypothetical protein
VKLVHLVGFFIRIYHDARSSECQIGVCVCVCVCVCVSIEILIDNKKDRYLFTTVSRAVKLLIANRRPTPQLTEYIIRYVRHIRALGRYCGKFECLP